MTRIRNSNARPRPLVVGLTLAVVLVVTTCTRDPSENSNLPLGPATGRLIGQAPLSDQQPPTLITMWGQFGEGAGEFYKPTGIALDAAGEVFVTDRINHRVQKFSPEGSFITMWSTENIHGVVVPYGIAIDNDHIYMTDDYYHRVVKFTTDGSYVKYWGWRGSGIAYFYHPCGIAVDEYGYLYIVDRGNHRVKKYTTDGAFVRMWGTQGEAEGMFFYPEGLAVHGGRVYVVDAGNDRIQVFTDDGVLITAWGTYGTAPGRLDGPSGIAVDESGDVYVAEKYNQRVQKFTANGSFIVAWGEFGSREAQFRRPLGVVTEGRGNVFVADTDNNRIQKFGFPIDVAFDVMPRSCTNVLRFNFSKEPARNRSSLDGGLVHVVIPGTPDLDVGTLDIPTLRVEGVAPARPVEIADRYHLLDTGSDCTCVVEGADGHLDLRLALGKRELAAVLESGTYGTVQSLSLTGRLRDLTLVAGEECLVVQPELMVRGECRDAVSGVALRHFDVEVREGANTFVLRTNGSGKFSKKTLFGEQLEVFLRFAGSARSYYDMSDRFYVRGDVSRTYALIPPDWSQVMPATKLFDLFKKATLTDGTAGNRVLRKWPTRPVPTYIGPYVNAEGLDYAEAARRAARRWMERTGCRLFRFVSAPPESGIELAYKTRSQMEPLIAITRHTQDEDGFPKRDVIEIVDDITSAELLYRIILHEFGHTIRIGHLPSRGFIMYGGQPLPGDITDDEVWMVKVHEALPNGISMSMYRDTVTTDLGVLEPRDLTPARTDLGGAR